MQEKKVIIKEIERRGGDQIKIHSSIQYVGGWHLNAVYLGLIRTNLHSKLKVRANSKLYLAHYCKIIPDFLDYTYIRPGLETATLSFLTSKLSSPMFSLPTC